MSGKSLLDQVRERLAAGGLRPRSALGQNFLIDSNLLAFVARQAECTSANVVLEVGPGTGCLTRHLCESGALVVAVEVCSELAEIVQRDLGLHPNLQLLRADALAGKHDLNPVVVRALRDAVASAQASAFKVVANLPYSIATPFIVALLLSDMEIERMVLMVQREAAERLVASPGTRQYGVPSVIARLGASVEVVRWVPPEVFWPRPKVESAVLTIRPESIALRKRRCPAEVIDMVRLLFGARRKTLRRALRLAGLDASGARDVAESLAIDGDRRVDSVTPEEFVLIGKEVRRRGL